MPGVQREAVALLWQEWLGCFHQLDLKENLLSRWPGDRNATERISYDFPPVFQPGYVGTCFGQQPRVVFVGYNPGHGTSRRAVEEDKVLMQKLADFADGRLNFQDYNDFLADQIFLWNIYGGMGIFREDNSPALSLIPEPLRPSVTTVGLLNAFPFKTRANERPLWKSKLAIELWRNFTLPVIRLLQPEIVVHYPDISWCSRDLKALGCKIIQVWHPSFNSRTRPKALAETWRPLVETLSEWVD